MSFDDGVKNNKLNISGGFQFGGITDASPVHTQKTGQPGFQKISVSPTSAADKNGGYHCSWTFNAMSGLYSIEYGLERALPTNVIQNFFDGILNLPKPTLRKMHQGLMGWGFSETHGNCLKKIIVGLIKFGTRVAVRTAYTLLSALNTILSTLIHPLREPIRILQSLVRFIDDCADTEFRFKFGARLMGASFGLRFALTGGLALLGFGLGLGLVVQAAVEASIKDRANKKFQSMMEAQMKQQGQVQMNFFNHDYEKVKKEGSTLNKCMNSFVEEFAVGWFTAVCIR